MSSQPRRVVYAGGTVSCVAGPAPVRTGFFGPPSPLPFFPFPPAPQVASRSSRASTSTPATRVRRTIFCRMVPLMSIPDLT